MRISSEPLVKPLVRDGATLATRLKPAVRAGVAPAALLAGGCKTQIATRPDLTRTEPHNAMVGMPYNPPMLQYKIDVTRTLSACPNRVMVPAEPDAPDRQELFTDPTSAFTMKVAATAAVAAATAADVLKQIDDDRTKRRADAATAEAQSVAGLQAQIDTLTKQAQLIALQTPNTADEQLAASTLVDLKAQTALIEAKPAKQKAHNELIAAGGSDD